jgi:AcrR family transcriptional regulator
MSTKLRRQREADQRRRSILNAARKLFFRDGYAGATIPQIASAAELAPGTLYLYFPSKNAIYAELLAEGYGLLEGRLRKAIQPAAAPRELAGRFIDAFFGFARENPEYFDIIFFMLRTRAGSDVSGRLDNEQVRRLQSLESQCKTVAAQLLPSLPGAGPASVDAVWSMLAGVVCFFRSDPDFQAVAAEARRLVVRGLIRTD